MHALFRTLFLSVIGLTLAPQPVLAQEDQLTGDWMGTLRIQSFELRIVFHVQRTGPLTWIATMDSPDQGATGIGVDSVSVDDVGTVYIGARRIGGSFVGSFQPGDSILSGAWNQGGASFPLDLRRLSSPIVVRRPQEPRPPFPYKDEEVTIDNGPANVSLSGTLTIPQGAGPFPAVVLVSGSGPQDRDERVFNHKPFLVIADHLARNGIAVLRYDDRGVGKSTGSFSAATSVDFAGDAEAAAQFLGTRQEIDGKKVGIDEGTIAKSQRANSEIFGIIRTTTDSSALRTHIRAVLEKAAETQPDTTASRETVDAAIERSLAQLTSPWFRFFITYDPYPTLTLVTCPVLALNGELDLQVPAGINLDGISRALKAGGNAHGDVRTLPELNHLFQTAKTGSPTEYASIEETFSPEALSIMSDWILSETNGDRIR